MDVASKRADFDQALANEIQKKGVDVRFNSTVKNVEFNTNFQLVEYENSDGEVISIRTNFIT